MKLDEQSAIFPLGAIIGRKHLHHCLGLLNVLKQPVNIATIRYSDLYPRRLEAVFYDSYLRASDPHQTHTRI